MKKRLSAKAGFTLIELLVVVLIIGILAAVAIPQYAKIVEKGRVAEALACADAMNGAEERYYLKANAYTSSPDVSCILKNFTTSITAGSSSWSITFTRTSANTGTAPGYGAYTFQFSSSNGSVPAFASGNAPVQSDLLP